MKKMVRQARCCLGVCIACAAVLTAALIRQPPYWKGYAVIFFFTGLLCALAFAAVSNRLASARLIVENQILHIQPAVLRAQDNKPYENVEMFVSCFGILLGSKVIKFNQEGIRLKAVEIGREYLSIDYGTAMDSRSIRLLYARPESDALEGIIEKFRYETGIIPLVVP